MGKYINAIRCLNCNTKFGWGIKKGTRVKQTRIICPYCGTSGYTESFLGIDFENLGSFKSAIKHGFYYIGGSYYVGGE